jgi:hypothetical protein
VIEQLTEYFSSGASSRPSGDFASQSAKGSKSAKRPLMRAGDVQELVEPVEQLILKYPAVALASAFMVGVFVAWWIKRK